MQQSKSHHPLAAFYLRLTVAIAAGTLGVALTTRVSAQTPTRTDIQGAAAAAHDIDNPLGLTINHATMGVADLEKQRAFYHTVLGFSIGLFRNRPQFDHQQMHIPGFRLDMIAQKGSTRPSPSMGNDKQGWLHIDFAVTDADTTYHHLKDSGVSVVPGRMEGDKVASMMVTDPEGNKVEITQPQ